MFNRLPKSIRMLSSCSVVGFKSKLDSYLRNIVDLPCRPGFNNSLDGGDCLHGGHYADGPGGQLDAAKQSKVAKSKYVYQPQLRTSNLVDCFRKSVKTMLFTQQYGC